MNVLVTGAFGFLGLPLLRRLAIEGFDVVAFGHPPRDPAAMALVPPGVRVVEGDILATRVPSNHVDFVVHLAGGGGPIEAETHPCEAVRVGVFGTQRVVAALRGARFIFASSIYVYPPDAGLCMESTPTAPETLYGAIKQAGEAALDSHGVVLRFGHIYGASPVAPDSVVDRFARAARAKQPIPLQGTGERRMDLLHLDDAVAAVVSTIVTPRVPRVVNIGGTVATTGMLAQWFAEKGGVTIEGAPPSSTLEPSRWLDSSRAKKVLEWVPRVDLDEGLTALWGVPQEGRSP